ncbi:MAG: hypothetical protein ACK4RS_01290 [Thiothrix sp.]
MRQRLRTLLFILFSFAASYTWAFVPAAQVKMESTQWGDANVADVQTVLESVLEVLTPYAAGRQFGTLLVKNDSSGPISVYEKGANGEYIIMLNVHGRYWAQLAYQFSHEMCHLLSNYDLAPNNVSQQQWFEEALCESFSLFTLEKLAAHWQDNPPYPQWREYAPKFLEYRGTNLQQPHRRLPDGMSMPKWYQQYRTLLSADPYAQERELNELVANQLLPLFSAEPDAWTAINYLNLGDDTQDKSLYRYLSDWQDNAPPQWTETILSIKKLLLNVDI